VLYLNPYKLLYMMSICSILSTIPYYLLPSFFFFLFNDTDTPDIYTLSLHDALPISLKWLETNNLFNNLIQRNQSAAFSSGLVSRSEERFSRNAETDLVCRLLLE